MRGKAYDRKQLGNSAGITPACAGKSLCGRCTRRGSRDHPRVCGEKVIAVGKKKSGWGSPPRVRGKVDDAETGDLVHRITPACAGKRVTPSLFLVLHRDHPRVCGEKFDNVRCWKAHSGITPACAGKRLKRSHSIGHFSCILCLFHSVLHRASVSGGSRAGPCAPPCLPAQNAVPV